MKLIEKKCPNCGASLEFSENDKSCKCQYCKRGFEIERESDDSDEYSLVEQKADKILTIVDIIVLFLAIFLIIYGSYKIYTIYFRHNKTLVNPIINTRMDY
ncbi:MAG: hypothetical protein IKF71_00415 [Bacilli bacterium]|nr:hypothetical protein [Bacilli bacterium]